MASICVYCSSSDAAADEYFEAARELGSALAARGHALVYGGTYVGLMGAAARAARVGGARVVGVIPRTMRDRGIAANDLDELIVVEDLRVRKRIMEERADAFIALPGGFGTIEELLEILTLRQLGLHRKPIVLLNVGGFWDPLAALFEGLYRARLAKPEARAAYALARDAETALNLAESEAIVELPEKWFRDGRGRPASR